MHAVSNALLTASLFLPAPAQGPRPPAGDEEAFERSLTKVERLREAGRWKGARELLLETLSEHARQAYVLERAATVRAIVADCDFWLGHERPEPKEVVGGKLLSYKASKGQIKLLYEPPKGTKYLASPPDFEDRDGALVHPAVFRGRSSIEIRGDGMGQRNPELRAAFDETYDPHGSLPEWLWSE